MRTSLLMASRNEERDALAVEQVEQDPACQFGGGLAAAGGKQ
jgi:hypothetical protein